MKFYYITAIICDRPMALCVSTELEYVGYNGAQLNHEISFQDERDIKADIYGRIAFLTAEEIEAVMMIKAGSNEKKVIMGCSTSQWAYVFKDTDIQVKEVSISI